MIAVKRIDTTDKSPDQRLAYERRSPLSMPLAQGILPRRRLRDFGRYAQA